MSTSEPHQSGTVEDPSNDDRADRNEVLKREDSGHEARVDDPPQQSAPAIPPVTSHQSPSSTAQVKSHEPYLLVDRVSSSDSGTSRHQAIRPAGAEQVTEPIQAPSISTQPTDEANGRQDLDEKPSEVASTAHHIGQHSGDVVISTSAVSDLRTEASHEGDVRPSQQSEQVTGIIPPNESDVSSSADQHKQPVDPPKGSDSTDPTTLHIEDKPTEDDDPSTSKRVQGGVQQKGSTLLKTTPSDIYAIDAGVIRCICGFDDDDGFTIQCESCNAWQHAQCVDIATESEVPEIYYCDRCSDRKVNVEAAIERQLRRIQNNVKKRKPKPRPRLDKNGPLTPGGSTAKDQPQKDSGTPRSVSPKGSASKSPELDLGEFGDDKERQVPKPRSKGPRVRRSNDHDTSRKHSVERDSADGEEVPRFIPEDVSANNLVDGGANKKKRRRLTVPDVSVGSEVNGNATHVVDESMGMSDNEEQDENASFLQSFNCQFVKVSSCRISTSSVSDYLSMVPTMDLDSDVCSFVSASEFAHIKPAKVTVRPTTEISKAKFSGFPRVGLFIDSAVQRDRFIVEFVGEVGFQEDYKVNPVNQYRLFGCPKPGVLFVPDLNIAVDGRRIGSEASFIRRSCQPNVKFSSMVVGSGKDKEPTVHFTAFAVEPIKAGGELTIAWDWDAHHPVHKLQAGEDPESLSREERQFLVRCSVTIQERGMECGCSLAADCILNRMRKADGAIGRTTRSRKGASLGPGADGGANRADTDNLNGLKGSRGPEPLLLTSSVYSTREERKLQGTVNLIEKLNKERQQQSPKRKAAAEYSSSGAQTGGDGMSPSNGMVKRDLASGQPLSGTAMDVDTTTADEPVIKKLRRDSFEKPAFDGNGAESTSVPAVQLAPRQKLFSQFLIAKNQFLATPKKAPVLSGATSPVLMSNRHFPTESSVSPGSGSSAGYFGLVNAGTPVASSSSAVQSPKDQGGSIEPMTPITPAPPAVGTSAAATRPVVKKKFSLSDYSKKKQQSTVSTGSTSGSGTAS